MRCAFRLQNLTRPNGLSPHVDSVFMTKRGCNGKNKFYIFVLGQSREKSGPKNCHLFCLLRSNKNDDSLSFTLS